MVVFFLVKFGCDSNHRVVASKLQNPEKIIGPACLRTPTGVAPVISYHRIVADWAEKVTGNFLPGRRMHSLPMRKIHRIGPAFESLINLPLKG